MSGRCTPSSDLPESPYATLLARARQTRRLLSVHWELTYRCNEQCSHCYLDVLPPGAPTPGELTTAECMDLLDEMAALGVLHLTLSGGEILLRRDFFAIAEAARERGLALRLFTNGTLIKEPVADRIAALYPYSVEISVYGAHAATHDAITRRPGSFALTLRAFRLLQARRVRTVFKTPLMRENVRQIHALKALAAQLGARFRYDLTITPKNSGDPAPLRHRLTYEDLLWFFRETLHPSSIVERPLDDACRTCNVGRNALVIRPNGEVYPCMEIPLRVGSVRAAPLRTIWEEAAVWRELDHLTLGDLPVCRTCTLRGLCLRCHGAAQREHGNLRAPATVNCLQALARRQVLVERGADAAAYPIPPHLETLATGASPAAAMDSHSTVAFIPLSALEECEP
ncbi:MAG: radical SAM protein [Caldilineaceae bacterium]|nr:radical SAM protein [Caldilineaceae bacterium]